MAHGVWGNVDAGGLSLRVRERSLSTLVADGAAFCGRPPSGCDPAELDVRFGAGREGRAVCVGAQRLVPVFFTTGPGCIPALGAVDRDADGSPWALKPAADGVLALTSLDPASSRPATGRAVTLIAACIPLALGPALAHAAPGSGGAVPSPTSPTPTSAAPVSPTPNVWTALVDETVLLTMKEGGEIEGRVLGVQGDTLLLARSSDGLVVVVGQVDIDRVNVREPERARLPGQGAPQTGLGMLITGGVLTGVGGLLAIGGISFGAICGANTYNGYDYGASACWYYWLPFILPASAALSVGIPLLAVGAKRHKSFRAQRTKPSARLLPMVGRTPTAWTGGLRLQF